MAAPAAASGGGGGPGASSSAAAAAASASLSLPLATQPDMVLAWEKDSFYTKQIHQQLKEMAEAVLGARRAELLGPEVESLGDLLYYGLTVFAGMETLGQEYCHLMFVEERGAGATGGGRRAGHGGHHRFLPLGKVRRGLVVAATVLANYVSERVLHREGWAEDYAQLRRDRRRRTTAATAAAATAAAAAGVGGGGQTTTAAAAGRRVIEPLDVSAGGASASSSSSGGEEESVAAWEEGGGNGDIPVFPPLGSSSTSSSSLSLRRVASGAAGRVQALLRRLAAAVTRMVEAHRELLQTLLPGSREATLRALQRLHLMLFFFTGRFYTFATRLAGARTMFIRQADGRRASYVVIGAFILLEMTLRGLAGVFTVLRRWLEDRRQARLEQQQQQQFLADGEPSQLLPQHQQPAQAHLPPPHQQQQQQQQPSGPPNGGGISHSASFTRALQTEARVPSGVNASRGRSWSIASDGLGGGGAGGGGLGGPGGSLGVEEQKKCALCMSQRRHPAVTPCGHVFCWRCILSWCAEQPECPLCRARVLPQAIIHVVNLGEGGKTASSLEAATAAAASASSSFSS